MKTKKKDAPANTTKMVFGEDKFVNQECVYNKGEIYDIPNASVDRWIKRGGKIVGEEQVEEVELAELDSDLAHELGDQDKIPPEEVDEADKKVDDLLSVHEDDEVLADDEEYEEDGEHGEDNADANDEPTKVQSSKKKKKKKKKRS